MLMLKQACKYITSFFSKLKTICIQRAVPWEYNLTFAPRNQKSEIREEKSKLIRKRRDKNGREEKNGKKTGGKGRKKEKIMERTEKIS